MSKKCCQIRDSGPLDTAALKERPPGFPDPLEMTPPPSRSAFPNFLIRKKRPRRPQGAPSRISGSAKNDPAALKRRLPEFPNSQKTTSPPSRSAFPNNMVLPKKFWNWIKICGLLQKSCGTGSNISRLVSSLKNRGLVSYGRAHGTHRRELLAHGRAFADHMAPPKIFWNWIKT